MTIIKQEAIKAFIESIGLDGFAVEARIRMSLRDGTPIPDDCLPGRTLMRFKESHPEEFAVLCTCTAKDWEHRV